MKKEEIKTTEEIKEGYPSESLQRIENDRSAFLATYRRQNTLKTVIAGICIAVIVVAFILFPSLFKDNAKLSSGLLIAVTVVALLASLGVSTFFKRSANKQMKVYFNSFYKNTNDFVFDNKGFSDVVLQEPGKIDLQKFVETGLYQNIVEVGSRGLTNFKYNDLDMSVVDAAGNVKGQKRIMPVFVGKFVFSTANYKEKDIIAFYLKGNEKALPPTNLEGVAKVVEDEKFDIYSNNKNWKKVLNADVMKLLEAFKPNEYLVDLAISVFDGKVNVMMGYDDPLMILPLQNKYDSKPYETYKKDLVLVVKLIEALNK